MNLGAFGDECFQKNWNKHNCKRVKVIHEQIFKGVEILHMEINVNSLSFCFTSAFSLVFCNI